MGGGCAYGKEDSNNDGTPGGFLDFFADITDGGGAGYSGARFGGGTGSSVLDSNNDMYISEEEYKRGQKASEANDDRGGKFGDAYNSSQNIFSKFGNNIFGALPSGSIASEAALGLDGADISTSGAARFLQRGGVLGSIVRGLTGGSIMSPEYVAPDRGKMTPDEYDRALVQSFSSIGNTGEETVPPEVAAAMGRLRGLSEGVATSSPVAVPMTRYMDESSEARGTKTETTEPNYVFDPDSGDFLVIGPSGEVLSRIPASALNMQNQ
tara:strand:+ start:307 stop:1107 length:801 start_codon:yes stop_codon:yes gene_type:complete